MIIVRLIGGLGNQMFQYALGRNLARINKTTLKLDKTELELKPLSGTPRSYNLQVFNIVENFASGEEIKKIRGSSSGRLFTVVTKMLKLRERSSVVSEKKDYVFDSRVLRSGDNVYIQGYWNNEKYFRDIRKMILKDFTIKEPIDKTNETTLNQINNTLSVSLHVRRGDYIKSKKTNQHHGTCGLGYYQNAINIIASKVKNPSFFAFSDEIKWVKNNLKTEYSIKYVDHNDDAHNYEDLRLMSACKHNIIANSSFSWWGAWLNPNQDKIVIAPKKWLNDPSIDTSDVTPKSWLRI